MFFEGLSVHLLIAAAVALIVVGPKDLPLLLRKLGQFMAKVRGMAAEFRASFDEMARQSELDELRKEVEAMRQGQFADIAAHAGGAETAQTFNEISQGLSDVGVQLETQLSYPMGGQTESIELGSLPKARKAKTTAGKAAPAKKAPVKKALAKPAAAASKPPRQARPHRRPPRPPAAKPRRPRPPAAKAAPTKAARARQPGAPARTAAKS